MEKEPRKSSIWYLLLGLWIFFLIQVFITSGTSPAEISYSQFKTAVMEGRVEEVSVSPEVIRGKWKAEEPGTGKARTFKVIRVEDPQLLQQLAERNIQVTGLVPNPFFKQLLGWFIPLVFFLGIWIFLMKRVTQGPGGVMAVGRSRAKVYMEKEVKDSFNDVAGVDEAKEELQEVIEFLRTPERFGRLGGKIPKGILLVGPPGTGKTLLARAVAGEAAVPFFSISGSEFVELFVGVGAARVRDLFLQAKEKAPCIIFIDELDALGKARGLGPMAHEEREQTLNQLLVEMDGFDPRVGVILMAATNRPEILDPALLRAGRFDRHVLVDRPDKIGRLEILKIHARKVPLESETDLEVIASMTPGFVGADLANIVNEAALLGVRRDKDKVGISELQEAVERVVAGLEKKNRVLNESERIRVAHHEVGHALVSLSIPGTDTVQKISIIPRGIAALGYTLQRPTEERFLMTKIELENKIAVLLGGRVAEEIVFGEISTGAHDDLQKATQIARSMVKVYGMSPTLGQVSFESDQLPLFIQPGQPPAKGDYSEETARDIDREIRKIIDEQVLHVRDILVTKEEKLREAAALLLEKETLSGEELKTIIERPVVRPALLVHN